MLPIEAWLRQELRKYAVALRKLAYELPNGVGEHNLLQLSAQMNTAAEQDFGAAVAPIAKNEPLSLRTRIEQKTRSTDLSGDVQRSAAERLGRGKQRGR